MLEIPGLDLNSFLKITANPLDTQASFDLQKELIKSPNRAESLKYLVRSCENSPELVKMYRDKYMKPLPTNEELLAMPKDSLGFHVGTHLKTHNIQLDFSGIDLSMFYNREFTLPVYLGIRVLRNHDVLHTLLKRDVSPLSEYYLFAFQIAQFQSPLHILGVAAGMLGSTLCHIIDPNVFFSEICEAFLRGKKAKFVYAFPFEDHWLTPIEEVRRELNITE